jgi:Mn-containing catalase
MNELETKKLLIGRIVAHFNPVPANAVQELLSQSVGELEVILENLASKADANPNLKVRGFTRSAT